ncbi:MAG: hypothetical protein ACYC1Q_01010 [Bacteroidia bacterium]
MIARIIPGFLMFFLSGTCHAQYLPGLWTFHAPGNTGMISGMLYPTEHVGRPYVGAAISTLPGLSFSSSGFFCYHQPVAKLEADLQLSTAVLSIGPYQEFSFKALIGRKFGKWIYVSLQPEYRQLRVRAYGSRSALAYSVALTYRQGAWLFAFYGQQQLGGEVRSPFLQMSWNYTFSDRIRVGLNLKKLPFFPWQTVLSLDYAPDKKQSFHLALSRGRGCLVGYERLRGNYRIRLGLGYSVNGGLYPENAAKFNW